MENFIEPYHVQFVHKKTTNQPLEDHYVVSDGHCLGSAVDLNSEQQEKAQEGTLSVSFEVFDFVSELCAGSLLS